MVVGIKPFGHFHRKLLAVTACQFGILLQIQARSIEAEAFRDRAEQSQGL